MANAPLLGPGRLKTVEVICPTGQAKYFCEQGWTQHSLICPSGKSLEDYAAACSALTSK
jgi:hypothetical protein